MDVGSALSGIGTDLGFGGVAGALVGYAAKKVTKLVAIILGLVFIAVQYLVYMKFVSVDWNAVQQTAEHVWTNPAGVTLADRAWQVLSANLPFGGAFAVGFGLGFKLG